MKRKKQHLISSPRLLRVGRIFIFLIIGFTICYFSIQYALAVITWPSPPTDEQAGGKIGNYIDIIEDTIYFDSTKVGIGTSTPQTALEVEGDIKITNGAIVGNTTNANTGAIRWTGEYFKGYDGNQWLDLGYTDLVPTIATITPANGLEGDSITITGTNFYRTAAVQIGGNDINDITVINDTEITINVPLIPSGNYDVAIINPRWETATSVNGFEYNFTCGDETVQDVDGNVYNTVLIGDQCWIAEDMRTTKYPDNSAITKGPIADGDVAWTTDNAYYSCPPNVSNNGEDCAAASTFGMLYQWSAAMNGSTSEGAQGICPNGWHIPTDAESKILIESQATQGCEIDDGEWYCSPAGDKLKIAADCSGSSDCGTSGFEKLISGYRSNGDYVYRGDFTQFWASTESGSSARRRSFYNLLPSVVWATMDKAVGNSVRCIKD